MSDLFHEDVPDEFIAAVFDVMVRADHHTFQVLTKRHERMAQLATDLPWPSNVWMGVTIENRRFIHRANYLRAVPASVRFISAEPLLGPLEGLDLDGIDWLISGGESGPRHRPVRVEWLRDLRDRCEAEGVAYFFKQWGGFRSKSGGRDLDGRTWDELPVAHEHAPDRPRPLESHEPCARRSTAGIFRRRRRSVGVVSTFAVAGEPSTQTATRA
jgi:protein gp37